MSQEDLDSFLYGRRGPPRAGPAPPPEAPPPARGPQRPPRERPERARRLPRIARGGLLRHCPDWRARFKAAALLCAAASVILTVLFLLSCGDRDPRGLCRPGLGGLGALRDLGKMGSLLAAAALSAGGGGGVGILLGPPRGHARLVGALWLAGVWLLYLLYLLGALGDPAKEGAALYQGLTNTSTTQGWLIALPYRLDDTLLGGRLGFPAALAAPVAFAIGSGIARLAGRRAGRRFDY